MGTGAGEAGSGSFAGVANMIGDLGVRGYAVTKSASGKSKATRLPLVGQGGFKIAENESPRPQTRVFLNYNYFNTVNTLGGTNFGLHRETIGFEYAFMDNNASVGMRLPLLQKDSSGGVSVDGFGDLSVILKYAVINDCQTGNVLSGGLVVTAPTGREVRLADGTNLHGVLLQPWTGFIVNSDSFYAHGFGSVVIPTVSQDVTFASIDVGVGFKAYQCQANEDATIRAIIPTLESHIIVPLNHRGTSNTSGVGLSDQFIITAGVHMGIGNNAWFTVGGAMPYSGPRPESYELIGQLNFKF
jgi:hypothetical protein